MKFEQGSRSSSYASDKEYEPFVGFKYLKHLPALEKKSLYLYSVTYLHSTSICLSLINELLIFRMKWIKLMCYLAVRSYLAFKKYHDNYKRQGLSPS
jgi:hypothetical protein